jgi:hypothetical protein
MSRHLQSYLIEPDDKLTKNPKQIYSINTCKK